MVGPTAMGTGGKTGLTPVVSARPCCVVTKGWLWRLGRLAAWFAAWPGVGWGGMCVGLSLFIILHVKLLQLCQLFIFVYIYICI